MLHVWLYTKIESTWHAFEPEVPNRYNRRSAGWKTEEFVSRPGQGFSGLETCRPALSPADPPSSWLLCYRGSLLVVEAVGTWSCHSLPRSADIKRARNCITSIPRCCMAWCVTERCLLLCMCSLDWSEQVVLGVKCEKMVLMSLHNEFKAHTKTLIEVGKVSFSWKVCSYFVLIVVDIYGFVRACVRVCVILVTLK